MASVKSYKVVKSIEDEEKRDLTTKEKFKLCWKYYIPAAITGSATISAIIGSNIISGKKEAAMASALALAEKGFEEYKEVVAEKLGEADAKEFQDKVVFDKIANTDSEDIKTSWVYETHGKTLCYDYYCGRYFYSDPEFLKSCEGEINRLYLTEGIIMLQQIYDEIDLASSNWAAKQLGWEVGEEVVDRWGTLQFIFDSKLTKDNKPVLIVRMNRDPKFVE